jgi:hypothetical protein
MLGITSQPSTVLAILMPYPASVLPVSLTVALTVICVAAIGWAIFGAKRR